MVDGFIKIFKAISEQPFIAFCIGLFILCILELAQEVVIVFIQQ